MYDYFYICFCCSVTNILNFTLFKIIHKNLKVNDKMVGTPYDAKGKSFDGANNIE